TSTEAEILKLASNAFHATKVSFANELMRICEPIGVSSETVMDLFCLDTKLNLSEKYLTQGFAWGGPCLGKDIRSLVALSPNLPLLNSLEESNSDHIEFFKEKILEKKPRRVAMIGLSFKPEVNDTRSSPILRLAESLALAPQIEAIVLFD